MVAVIFGLLSLVAGGSSYAAAPGISCTMLPIFYGPLKTDSKSGADYVSRKNYAGNTHELKIQKQEVKTPHDQTVYVYTGELEESDWEGGYKGKLQAEVSELFVAEKALRKFRLGALISKSTENSSEVSFVSEAYTSRRAALDAGVATEYELNLNLVSPGMSHRESKIEELGARKAYEQGIVADGMLESVAIKCLYDIK